MRVKSSIEGFRFPKNREGNELADRHGLEP